MLHLKDGFLVLHAHPSRLLSSNAAFVRRSKTWVGSLKHSVDLERTRYVAQAQLPSFCENVPNDY